MRAYDIDNIPESTEANGYASVPQYPVGERGERVNPEAEPDNRGASNGDDLWSQLQAIHLQILKGQDNHHFEQEFNPALCSPTSRQELTSVQSPEKVYGEFASMTLQKGEHLVLLSNTYRDILHQMRSLAEYHAFVPYRMTNDDDSPSLLDKINQKIRNLKVQLIIQIVKVAPPDRLDQRHTIFPVKRKEEDHPLNSKQAKLVAHVDHPSFLHLIELAFFPDMPEHDDVERSFLSDMQLKTVKSDLGLMIKKLAEVISDLEEAQKHLAPLASNHPSAKSLSKQIKPEIAKLKDEQDKLLEAIIALDVE